MKIFVTIFDGWKLLIIVTKIFILDVTGEAPLVIFLKRGPQLQRKRPMRSTLNIEKAGYWKKQEKARHLFQKVTYTLPSL